MVLGTAFFFELSHAVDSIFGKLDSLNFWNIQLWFPDEELPQILRIDDKLGLLKPSLQEQNSYKVEELTNLLLMTGQSYQTLFVGLGITHFKLEDSMFLFRPFIPGGRFRRFSLSSLHLQYWCGGTRWRLIISQLLLPRLSGHEYISARLLAVPLNRWGRSLSPLIDILDFEHFLGGHLVQVLVFDLWWRMTEYWINI